MNQPYSHWYAQNSPENLPLAARYQSADPITWNGSLIYPMYTEQVGPAPIQVTMRLLSAAPPAGLRGHGIGLSVVDGHIGIDGRRLAGVDAWSDALAAGVTFEVFPTDPGALFSLTPVWVDGFGAQKSWAGNYGILIEQPRGGRVVLWCSVGEGPPNFANLVVEVETASMPAVTVPTPAAAPNVPAPQPPPPTEPRQERSAEPTPPTQPQRAVSVTPAQPRLPEPQQISPDLEVVRFPEPLQTAYTRPEVSAAEQTAPLQAARTRLEQPSPSAPVPREPTPDSDHTRLPEPPKPGNTGPSEPPQPASVRLPEPPQATRTEFMEPPQPVHTEFLEPSQPVHTESSELPQPARTEPAEPPRPVHTQLPETPPPARPRSQDRANDSERGYRAALYDLGVAMFGRGEEEQACGLWAQAADAGHAGAAYDLGVVLFQRGELGDAERWWRAAAERRESRAMTGLADLLERQGNHAEAEIWRACAAEEKTDEHDQSVNSG